MRDQTKKVDTSVNKNEVVDGTANVLGGGRKGDITEVDGDTKMLTDDITGQRFIFFTPGSWTVGMCVNYTPDYSNPVQGFPQAKDVTPCE